MPDDIKIKHYFGESADRPEVDNGKILFETDTHALYADHNNQRIRYNPPADWNETNESSPSFIANKPDLTSSSGSDWIVLENTAPIYGVEWDYTNPSSKLRRTFNAKDFSDPVPATTLEEMGSSPFDNIYPWSEMKIVNILPDGTIVDKSDDEFSYILYDVMVWIPEFWYRTYKDKNIKKWTWEISGVELDGFKKHPGSGRYISRYHISSQNKSCSQGWPYYKERYQSYCLIQFSNQNIKLLDINTWSAIQMLYLIEYANFNSRAMLGTGMDGRSGQMGNTDTSIYHTLKRSKVSNMYRYIEDPFSNVFDCITGIYGIDGTINIVNYNTSKSETYVLDLPDDGYITDFQYDNDYDWLFIPCKTNNDSSYNQLYVTDGYIFSDEYSIIAIGGSEYNFSNRSGMFSFTAYPEDYIRHIKSIGIRTMYYEPS